MTDYFKLASPTNPTDREPLTPEQQDTINDVLDACAAWEAGDLPFYQAAAIGSFVDWQGNESPAYSRYVAITRTHKDDPRRHALVKLLDVLIHAEGFRITRQGVYQSWEIRENEAGWQHANLERDAA